MKKLLRIPMFLAAMLFSTISIFAHDFEVDGIYYNIEPSSSLSCSVTHQGTSDSEYADEYIGDVVIPDKVIYNGKTYSVVSVGYAAFSGCSNLTSIIIPEGVTTIGNLAFASCYNLINITIPEGVTSIGSSAFEGCSSITSIVIPKGVSSIRRRTFDGCSSLASVTIPEGVMIIDTYAFYGCSSLASVIIPEGVTSIGKYAFSGCSSLASVTIPGGVTSIGESAFRGCSSLASVTIPEGVTSIDVYTFSGCSSLASVIIPEGVTSIGEYAFSGCSSLASVTIPEGVNSIGRDAFSGCSSLASVTIPEGVSSIGTSAFAGCSKLTGILELPSTILSVDETAFADTRYIFCRINSAAVPTTTSSSLPYYIKTVLVPQGCKGAYKNDDVWGKYTIVEEGTCNIEITNETAGELSKSILTQTQKDVNDITGLVIHGSLNSDDFELIRANMTSLLHLDISDTDVTEIPAYTFENNSTLMTIKFPENLKVIGNSAFSGSYLCCEISLPETLETIEEDAFDNCKGLSGNLEIPSSVSTIGDYAFYGCYTLKNVDMSAATKLMTLSRACFYGCEALETVKLPKTIVAIGSSAFRKCYALTEIAFPEHLKQIESSLFYGCRNLKVLDLSGCTALTTIESSAFYGCSTIETVNFPPSLTTIGTSSFANCISLSHISVPCAIPPVIASGTDPFLGVDKINCILSIPTDNFVDYCNANYWGSFVDTDTKSDISITVVGADNGDCKVRYRKCINKDMAESLSQNVANRLTENEEKSFDAISCGGQSLFVANGDAVMLEIIPVEGKEIESVMYNNEDVTSQLVNNTFVSPEVNASSTLNITLNDTVTSAIGSCAVSEKAEEVLRYDVSGRLLAYPMKGINIVKMSDGTVRKEIVK